MKFDFSKDAITEVNGIQVAIAAASNPDPHEMMISLANVESNGGFAATIITPKGMEALTAYCEQNHMDKSAAFIKDLHLGPLISIEGFTAERMSEEEIQAAMHHELFHVQKGKVLPAIIDNVSEVVFDLEEELAADQAGALAASNEAMASVIKKCIRSSIEAHHLLRMGGIIHPELVDQTFALQMSSPMVQKRLNALGFH